MTNGLCAKCGGIIEDRRIGLDRRMQGRLLIFADVPARVCAQCGEIWLSASTAKEMDRALSEAKRIVRIEQVPVVSLAEVKS